jgi:hypothetical protein
MRTCGSCTLCCKLVPVEELAKKAGTRCQHVRAHKGCSIYAHRPLSCREWSCMWLVGTEDGAPLDLRRPDHVHYVIDISPDVVRARDNQTGEVVGESIVMQIWVDPKFPDAWQDPDLLDMLERGNIRALIRYSESEAFGLFPPGSTTSGKWERSDKNETVKDADLEAARLRARVSFFNQPAGGPKQEQAKWK